MKKVIKSICVTPEDWELLKKIAEKHNRSISNMIIEMAKKEK